MFPRARARSTPCVSLVSHFPGRNPDPHSWHDPGRNPDQHLVWVLSVRFPHTNLYFPSRSINRTLRAELMASDRNYMGEHVVTHSCRRTLFRKHAMRADHTRLSFSTQSDAIDHRCVARKFCRCMIASVRHCAISSLKMQFKYSFHSLHVLESLDIHKCGHWFCDSSPFLHMTHPQSIGITSSCHIDFAFTNKLCISLDDMIAAVDAYGDADAPLVNTSHMTVSYSRPESLFHSLLAAFMFSLWRTCTCADFTLNSSLHYMRFTSLLVLPGSWQDLECILPGSCARNAPVDFPGRAGLHFLIFLRKQDAVMNCGSVSSSLIQSTMLCNPFCCQTDF